MIPGSCSCPPSALFYHLRFWGSLHLQENELLSCLCEGATWPSMQLQHADDPSSAPDTARAAVLSGGCC